MRYQSTRANHEPTAAASAIALGMVPKGGLFVPESTPQLDLTGATNEGYGATALRVLSPLLDDFTRADLGACVARAYSERTFSVPGVVALPRLDARRWVLELFHGPTAAFKDVALQIMPELMNVAKRATGDRSHTVILVATSGDTGKAALEGFKDRPGVSIVVFYPHGGVSEIQRLQMATTEGSNTHVVAVRGNFDDCQTAVKNIFADPESVRHATSRGCSFSSANSINWGRLCPQIAYYVRAYLLLAETGEIGMGDPVDLCVPTGNFGNILAGYYAMQMGLPVRRLVCASNRNNVLAEFFATGTYDTNRTFYRTMSPSMDILISSNLERFLFEMAGRDASRIRSWYGELALGGRFTVDAGTKAAMGRIVVPGWVDESRVLAVIGDVYRRTGYVLDTHTAVGVAVSDEVGHDDVPTIIAATASPYKFGPSVVLGLTGERVADELAAIARLYDLSGVPIHRAVAGLRDKPVRHDAVVDEGEMKKTVASIVEGVGKA
jgi:threonine synthase